MHKYWVRVKCSRMPRPLSVWDRLHAQCLMKKDFIAHGVEFECGCWQHGLLPFSSRDRSVGIFAWSPLSNLGTDLDAEDKTCLPSPIHFLQVLDELYRLLHQLQKTDTQPPRSYDLLQGLRDLSTMAMEHFEEVIVPILKAQMNECSQSLYFSGPSSSLSWSLSTSIGSGPSPSNLDTSGNSGGCRAMCWSVMMTVI